jgi:hypothetical protein
MDEEAAITRDDTAERAEIPILKRAATARFQVTVGFAF